MLRECVLLFLVFLLFLPITMVQADETEENTTKDESPATPASPKFGASISGGTVFSFWKPGLDGEDIITYDTSGMKAYQLNGNIYILGQSISMFNYESPFNKSDEQNSMINANKNEDKSGVEQFVGGIRLYPLAQSLFGDNNLVVAIFAVKYKYTRERYFGKVTSDQDFAFVSKSANYNPTTNTISGVNIIQKGETLSFQTDFVESEITIGGPLKKSTSQEFRFGYFQSEWTRPSHGDKATFESYPIITESTFKVKGIVASFNTVNEAQPGPNLDLMIKLGITGEVENAFNYSDQSIAYLDFGLNFWYNYYFSRNRDKGFFLKIGGSFDQRRLVVDDKETAETNYVKFEDEDRLYKLYANIAYGF